MFTRALRPLYDHQDKCGIPYCESVEHPALLWEMRLGKSLVALRSLFNIITSWNNGLLIVAPGDVLYGWEEECLLEGIPQKEIAWLTGKQDDRYCGYNKGRLVNLINKEGWRYIPEIGDFPWDAMIVDESPFIKNPQSDVSKFFVNRFRKVRRRHILTGTIAPEDDMDAIQQLLFLDPKILHHTNYYKFRHRFCNKLRNKGQYHLRRDGKQYLADNVSQYCSVLTRKDVGLDVKKVFEKRYCTLPNRVRTIYNTALKEFILEVDHEILNVTSFAVTRYMWMRRICGGVLEEGQFLHTGKIDMLIDLMNSELANTPILIYSDFVWEVQLITAVLRNYGFQVRQIHGNIPKWRRRESRELFRSGALDAIVVQPGTFRYGIDASIADTVVYYSLPEPLETWQQSMDRPVKVFGHPVLYILLLAKDTIDLDKFVSLQKKETRSGLFRRILNSHKNYIM